MCRQTGNRAHEYCEQNNNIQQKKSRTTNDALVRGAASRDKKPTQWRTRGPTNQCQILSKNHSNAWLLNSHSGSLLIGAAPKMLVMRTKSRHANHATPASTTNAEIALATTHHSD